MRTPGPTTAGERPVAVLIEPPKDVAALEYAVALAAAAGTQLITLVPRPRLLRGPIQLAGYDPDELAGYASAARKSEVHRLLEELAPGLPHLILEVDRLHFRDSVRLAESYSCSTLVLPRPASVRARLTRPLNARTARLRLVVAP
jgi:hypothetical protein